MLDVFRVMKYSYLGVQWLKYAYLVEYFERVPVRILSVSSAQSKRWTQPKVRLLGTICIFTTLKTTAVREQYKSGFEKKTKPDFFFKKKKFVGTAFPFFLLEPPTLW
jgi:hypothetical protein